MRLKLFSLLILVSASVFGQQKWEYGLNLNFNTSFVKPISADTLTNKAGFGAGLMLERKFKTFNLQYNQNYTQTRYFDDFANFTAVSNAIDASLLVLHPLDASRQTFINYGLITTLNFLFDEKHLSGLKEPIRNTQIENNPFDYGLQIGLGLDLNPGARFTINYMDFFGGKQSSSGVQGQIDYLQFGMQIRFNELLNSDRIKQKNDAIESTFQKAKQQVDDLSTAGDGLLVFVIGTRESGKTSIFNQKTAEEKEKLRNDRINNIWNSINAHYNFGSFVITTDSMLVTGSSSIKILTATGDTMYSTEGKQVYYARIDEMFLSESGLVKWGVFVFDADMNLLKDPFPYFTPYRQLDQKFETADVMIKSFNQRLQQYGIIED